MNKKLWAVVVAELIGTFALTFIGGGAILHGKAGLVGVAIAHGLALCVMISAFGHISGGQFNPSVTLGLLSIGKVKFHEALMCWMGQFGGAVLAGLLLTAVFPKANLMDATPALATGVSTGIGILVEALLTFFLLIAVLLTAVDARAPKIGGFGIGLTVCMDILMGGPVTGAAMNQARWFGTMLFARESFPASSIVYIVGPAIGGIAASLAYKALFSSDTKA